MPTIAEQLTQLQQDREDLVDNLETQGIDDLTGDETFTELVPRVLDIEGGGGGGTELVDAIITGTITSISSNVTSIRDRAFQGCISLTSVNMPEVTNAGGNTFNGCTLLSDVSLPKLTQLAGSAFAGCTSLEEIYLKNLVSAGSSAFSNCSNLRIADVGPLNSLLATLFNNCASLEALILRKTTICALGNVNTFTNSGILNGGHVYVPEDLIETYKAATNWVTIYGSNPNVFQKIEGSVYE